MKKQAYILIVFLCSYLFPTVAKLQVNNPQIKKIVHQLVSIGNKSILYKQLDSLNKLKGLNIENTVEIKVHLSREALRLLKYSECLTLSYEGIELAKKYGFDSAHSAFYKAIGSVNYYTHKLPESIEFFKKSLAIAEEKNITILRVANYQNIGGVSIDDRQIDTAYKYLNLAISASKSCGEKCVQFRLMALRLLATLYEREKQYNKAEALFKTVEAEAIELKDTMVMASVLLYHSNLLSAIGKKQIAIQKSELAVKLMREFSGRHDVSFYSTLSQLAARKSEAGDYKEAAKIRLELLQLQTVTFKRESQQEVNELETLYKVKEIEQEKNIATANALAETQQKKMLLLVLIVVVLVAALAFAIIYSINKKRQAEAKMVAQKLIVASVFETEEKERSRIAKDLHDGIVQDLTAIKMNLKSSAQAAPEILQQQLMSILHEVDTAAKEVREISYQMMPVTLKELGLLQALNELLNRSLKSNNISFDYDSHGIENRLSEKVELTVYRICQELINNTIKHSGASHVSMFIQLRNNILQVTYEDNGSGFDSKMVNKGIGLASLGSRIETVNGSLEFDNTISNGTTAYIRIPI